jgi:hypothetical protein
MQSKRSRDNTEEAMKCLLEQEVPDFLLEYMPRRCNAMYALDFQFAMMKRDEI